MNPLLSREIRERFRDGRAFVPIFIVVAGLSLLFVWLFGQNAPSSPAQNANPASSKLTGHAIFTQLAWGQTLGWLLIAPALTSSAIAYERERGWFDSLLLSCLLPRQIALGKWAAALLYAALLYAVGLPFLALTFLLGGVSGRQFLLIVLLHAACALCGAALGLAASAWSPRAASALRTAHGLIFLGFGASLFGAASAGELPFRFVPVPGGNLFFTYLGRTNPVLRALEISGDLGFQRLGICLGFLGVLTLFFLVVATHYAGRPLEEAPLIIRHAPKSAKKATSKSASHAEIPLLSRLRFANPVLDRDVRAKFRMRQPPLGVIIGEIVLGILVAGFYGQTLFWALFNPSRRALIWWGLCFTALIVSMMAAAVMGSNALSREREGGTWKGLQLSLLSPDEILRGKVFASLLTCALFSLPVWPLLLPCIAWHSGVPTRGLIAPSDALACGAIWLATVWSYTLAGMWIGRLAPRTGRASGQTLGVLTGFLVLSPVVTGQLSADFAVTFLGLTHPLVALFYALDSNGRSITSGSGAASYCVFQVCFGVLMWFLMRAFLAKELARPAKQPNEPKSSAENAL